MIRVNQISKLVVVFILLAAASLVLTNSFAAFPKKTDPPLRAPEFTQMDSSAWFNSEPLSIKDLRGKVVLLDIWTYGCWNCYRSFPWLRGVEEKFVDQDFQVIGIHTPEFDREKEKDSVEKKIAEFMLHHPVMIDNDFAYWRALNNRFWPTYYLIDKKGKIRNVFIGETHAGDSRAVRIESAITALLEE